MSVEELREYGLSEMMDDEIQRFLSNQRVGVLGLPEEEEPYLLPLLFGYGGDARLHFTYLIGSDSRKTASSETAETGFYRFRSTHWVQVDRVISVWYCDDSDRLAICEST